MECDILSFLYNCFLIWVLQEYYIQAANMHFRGKQMTAVSMLLTFPWYCKIFLHRPHFDPWCQMCPDKNMIWCFLDTPVLTHIWGSGREKLLLGAGVVDTVELLSPEGGSILVQGSLWNIPPCRASSLPSEGGFSILHSQTFPFTLLTGFLEGQPHLPRVLSRGTRLLEVHHPELLTGKQLIIKLPLSYRKVKSLISCF